MFPKFHTVWRFTSFYFGWLLLGIALKYLSFLSIEGHSWVILAAFRSVGHWKTDKKNGSLPPLKLLFYPPCLKCLLLFNGMDIFSPTILEKMYFLFCGFPFYWLLLHHCLGPTPHSSCTDQHLLSLGLEKYPLDWTCRAGLECDLRTLGSTLYCNVTVQDSATFPVFLGPYHLGTTWFNPFGNSGSVAVPHLCPISLAQGGFQP